MLLSGEEKDIKNKATTYTNIEINGIKKTLKVTMDTGAQVNIIPEHILKMFDTTNTSIKNRAVIRKARVTFNNTEVETELKVQKNHTREIIISLETMKQLARLDPNWNCDNTTKYHKITTFTTKKQYKCNICGEEQEMSQQ